MEQEPPSVTFHILEKELEKELDDQQYTKDDAHILLDSIVSQMKLWKSKKVQPINLIIRDEGEWRTINEFRSLRDMNNEALCQKIVSHINNETRILNYPKPQSVKILNAPKEEVHQVQQEQINNLMEMINKDKKVDDVDDLVILPPKKDKGKEKEEKPKKKKFFFKKI